MSNMSACEVLREVLCESVWYVYQCVRAWVCVCLREAQWVGESGSAGTHSCFMVLFQEELLDLLVFTGSQFVCLCVCVYLCLDEFDWVLVPSYWATSLTPHSPTQLHSHSCGLPLKFIRKLTSSLGHTPKTIQSVVWFWLNVVATKKGALMVTTER